jgi:hypothetical protein
MKCAFNFFKEPGRVKNITMVKPYIIADGTFTPTMAVDADFVDSTINAPVIVVQNTGAVWDGGVWDVSMWGQNSTFVNAAYQTVNALGTALAVRMNVNYGGNQSSVAAGTGYFDEGQYGIAVFDGNQTLIPGSGLPTLQVVEFEAIVTPGGPV